MHTRTLGKVGLTLTAMMWASVGCGPVGEDSLADVTGQVEGAQQSDNGLSFNGLSFNGLSFNGLSFNGLSFNGLSTSAFNNWFKADPSMADQVMRYVVRCALPAGQTLTYTPPSSSTTYTWGGGLGLAPAWASGGSATLAEQQVVSACLAAHANRLGAAVPISVLGRDAAGTPIAFTSAELAEFSRPESCFFGNLFNGEGVFVAAGPMPLGPSESTSRACGGLLNGGTEASAPCAPMTYVGSCAARCTPSADGTSYTSCTWNGVTYTRPVTTRLRPRDIAVCGDGQRQASETCGTTSRYDSCGLDGC
jgi:hypothetical protein